jgi:predicted kinase
VSGKRPLLIIIHGAPASGKTTLAHKLRKDLGISIVAADDIKEYFFDAFGEGVEKWSHELGKSLKPYLYDIVELALKNGHSLIYESAFWTEYAHTDMQKLISLTGVRAVEIYCHVPEAVRAERYAARISNGSRHQAHGSLECPSIDKYGRIGVCEIIDVDTNQLNENEYAQLREDLLSRLSE